MISTQDFCLLFQQMRKAQTKYFASKKGHRWPTKESNELLSIAKKLEAELDLLVEDYLAGKLVFSPLDKEYESKCRECGCTDLDCTHCIEKDGFPCHWVEEDLCSSCYNEKEVGNG